MQFIVSIFVRIHPATLKLHEILLIILSSPFGVNIRPIVSSNYMNKYIKCKGYSSPRLPQGCLFLRTTTNSCDVPSFDEKVQLYDHSFAIFKHQMWIYTQNIEEMFATNPASVISIRLLYPSPSSFSTWNKVHMYLGTYALPLISGSQKNKEEQTIIDRKHTIANTQGWPFIIIVTLMLERHQVPSSP